MKMNVALTKVLTHQCRVNTQGLLNIGIKGHEMKRGGWGRGGHGHK